MHLDVLQHRPAEVGEVRAGRRGARDERRFDLRGAVDHRHQMHSGAVLFARLLLVPGVGAASNEEKRRESEQQRCGLSRNRLHMILPPIKI